jgi:hypothetical protein
VASNAGYCLWFGIIPPERAGKVVQRHTTIERSENSFPVQYPGANVPQAWAAGSVFALTQSRVDVMESSRYVLPAAAEHQRCEGKCILRSSAGSLCVEMAGGISRPSTRTYDRPISPWATRRPCGYEYAITATQRSP